MKTKPWTSEDDNLLRQEVLAGTRTDLITSRVGRSKSGVKHQVSILGLTLGRVKAKPRSQANWDSKQKAK
jgi:hypothetical protein